MIITAAQFAAEKHKGQTRKSTGRPYTEHLFRVAGNFAAHKYATDTGVIVALLHDTLEDTKTTSAELVTNFGIDVANEVLVLTKPKDDRPRKVRNAEYFERLASASQEICIIKMIDRLDNLNESQNMPPGFIERYCAETWLLLNAIGFADRDLKTKIVDRAEYLQKHLNPGFCSECGRDIESPHFSNCPIRDLKNDY